MLIITDPKLLGVKYGVGNEEIGCSLQTKQGYVQKLQVYVTC